MKIDTNLKANINVMAGSSGSGKSYRTKQAVSKAKRLLIWDIDDEHGNIRGIKTFSNIAQLASALKSSKSGKFRYVGNKSDFDVFCQLSFAWGHHTVVVEELAGVTAPAKAPDGWHTLVSRGRKRGISIYAITQRPAESDKTIMGNASTVQCGWMRKQSDRLYMAKEMGIDVSFINDLNREEYEFIESYDDGTFYRGSTLANRKGEIQP